MIGYDQSLAICREGIAQLLFERLPTLREGKIKRRPRKPNVIDRVRAGECRVDVGKRRDLPWRRTSDPYAIWVSEIMLQQTQVKTVIPYWERWMRELPTIQSVASATPAKLHKLWEGLGYYTRVRNLHRAARQIVDDAVDLAGIELRRRIVAGAFHPLHLLARFWMLRRGPLLTFNCATIQPTLAEGTLFGTVKGAFSDAKDTQGLFMQANLVEPVRLMQDMQRMGIEIWRSDGKT